METNNTQIENNKKFNEPFNKDINSSNNTISNNTDNIASTLVVSNPEATSYGLNIKPVGAPIYERRDAKHLSVIAAAYQAHSEAELEAALIKDLVSFGYEYKNISNETELLSNLRNNIEKLNSNKLQNLDNRNAEIGKFSDNEWKEFLSKSIGNNTDNISKKASNLRKSHELILDNGEKIEFILFSPEPSQNFYQVINQFKSSYFENTNQAKINQKYDVTILINGLPLVHVELKSPKMNVQKAIKEAWGQIQRYQRGSMSQGDSYHLFEYIQTFIISNGITTNYFANDALRDGSVTLENSLTYWTDENNNSLSSLAKFTGDFLLTRHLGKIIYHYTFTQSFNGALIALRPYQIYGAEAINNRIQTSITANTAGSTKAGGFIWHTTGSGKTLTSFAAAKTLGNRDDVDLILFIVDRTDLNNQTIREFEKFQNGSVDNANNNSSKTLREILLGKSKYNLNNKLLVTTIQKLDNLAKSNYTKEIKNYYKNRRVVIIFDECHRSQAGSQHKKIKEMFTKHHIFGFTGTPIFAKNSRGEKIIYNDNDGNEIIEFKDATETLFGDCLHVYNIIPAIRDRKVLPFHNEVRDVIITTDKNSNNSSNNKIDNNNLKRIKAITSDIISHWQTRQTHKPTSHYNALFAVESITAANLYYKEFKKQIEENNSKKEATVNNNENKKIKIPRVAMIYTFGSNEYDQSTMIDFDSDRKPPKLAREQLELAMKDINKNYNQNFDTNHFNEYRSFIMDHVAGWSEGHIIHKWDIDILIVVNMMLTGFDAKTLDTLYLDKNLQLHNLLQAWSRTNRVHNQNKPHGNVVLYRDLESEIKESFKLFGNNCPNDTIIEVEPYENYKQYYKEAKDILSEIGSPESESQEIEFVKAYNKMMKAERSMQSFIDKYKTEENGNLLINDELKNIYADRYGYIFIHAENKENISSDFQNLTFEIELAKEFMINRDYIIALTTKIKHKDKKESNDELDDALRLIKHNINFENKEIVEEYIDLIRKQVNNDMKPLLEWHDFIKNKAQNNLREIVDNSKYPLSWGQTKRWARSTLKTRDIESFSIDELKDDNSSVEIYSEELWDAKIYSEKLLLSWYQQYVDEEIIL